MRAPIALPLPLSLPLLLLLLLLLLFLKSGGSRLTCRTGWRVPLWSRPVRRSEADSDGDGKRAFLDVVFMESDVWLYWKSCPRQQTLQRK
ncbi:unnamed protein product [Gadus morhua 'NCC']